MAFAPLALRFFVSLMFCGLAYLWAAPVIVPSSKVQILHTQDIITRLVLFERYLFVGDSQGGIGVYEFDKNRRVRKVEQYHLASIRDYFGNEIPTRIFDIATFDGKLLYVLAEGSQGSKEIVKIAKGMPAQVLWKTQRSPTRLIAVDKNKLAVGFLSNEVGIFDLVKADFDYVVHPSLAGFSDMCVGKPYIFSTDESGAVNVLDISNGNVLKKLDLVNKDNNYQIATSHNDTQGIILTAGTDKQMGIYSYELKQDAHDFHIQKAQSIKGEFLIYAVGISPQAKRAAYSKNEQNDIAIVSLLDLQEQFILRGSTSLLNSLIFYDENTLISSSDDKNIIIWKID